MLFCMCVYTTGPMLIHLVKRSSAWMCSYSSLTAFPLSMVLWWASYTFNTTAGQQEHSHRVRGGTFRATVREIPFFSDCEKHPVARDTPNVFLSMFYVSLTLTHCLSAMCNTFVCHHLTYCLFVNMPQ